MNELTDIQPLPDESSLYDILQERALEAIRELSGQSWTDYAPHDPGITILDTLNYALSELDYQMSFLLEDYLADPENHFDPEKYGLFSPRRVFQMNPVTLEDYQSKLLDASTFLFDVQIHPYPSNDEACGWVDIFIELSAFIADEQRTQEIKAAQEETERLFHNHRNLCEGLHEIHLIQRKPLSLVGNIDIDGSLSPEKTLIAIYTEAIKLFAPGSHYTGKGLPIYNLFKEIKEIQGVQSIQSLEFEGFEEGENVYTLSLSSVDQVKIQLFRNRHTVDIDLTKVLSRLHSRSNIRHAIREPKKKEEPIVMDSRHIYLGDYSVFNDFPICYKDSATDSFKTYLAIFDHLFSGAHEEINYLQDWMALDTDTPSSLSMRRNKDLLLDTLDKIYGENSNLPFLRLPDEAANRQRRIRFLRQLPELVRDRSMGINLLDPGSTSGLEKYIRAIFGWEEENERIYVIENLLLFPPAFQGESRLPREFTLSIVIPQTKQINARPDFSLRFSEFLRERIPAHLRFTLYWLPDMNMALFRQFYFPWRKAWATKDTAAIFWLGNHLADHLVHIENLTQN